MKKKLINTALYFLAVFMIGAGLFSGYARIQMQKHYTQAISQAESDLGALDTAAVDALETELEELKAEIARLQDQIQQDRTLIGDLEQETQQLQQEYAALETDEEVAYYQAIYDSLMEGMSKVEGYINGDS